VQDKFCGLLERAKPKEESKKGRRGEVSRSKKANATTRFRSERQACPRQGTGKVRGVPSYALARPREVAKPAGTPNSRIVTCPAVSRRAGPRQPLCPSETGMGTFGTGKRRGSEGWRSRVRILPRLHLKLDALGTKEVHARAPVYPSAPVMPEERLPSYDEGMEEHADLTRLCCGVAIPLALLAQRTGTTTANAGSIHHAQASIGFSALLMRDQLWSAGHRSVPSGWRTKSWPEKRPDFQDTPM
jgi:hypothetical protein